MAVVVIHDPDPVLPPISVMRLGLSRRRWVVLHVEEHQVDGLWRTFLTVRRRSRIRQVSVSGARARFYASSQPERREG